MNLEWIYIPWGVGILIALYFLYRALKRIIKGIISYRTLGKKEFKKRLSKGFDEITATQKTKGELISISISQIGLLLGLILVPIFRIEGLWIAIELTFLGGFGINLFGFIGKLQQYRVFKKQDELMKELEEQDENN